MSSAAPLARSLPLAVMHGSPYVAYAYSYPHKTAYRQLTPARPLTQTWHGEQKHALFLYLHIPFCEMRCGFCNLFTTANPHDDTVGDYLSAMERQAKMTSQSLGTQRRIARMAIGGGTPSYLEPAQLERLFSLAGHWFGVNGGEVPTSVETSPRTAHLERLKVLKSCGVDRISIGVQSFVESEVAASGRAQRDEWVESALERIRALKFQTLNIDLIYGLPGQSVKSWLVSLHSAMRWKPEELYLYPLYVRPLTGLGRRGASSHDLLRLHCYQTGRDLLLSEGYEQISMRMFRRTDSARADKAPVYCCQDDGMVGLGCGARSYTRELHYSNEFAVGASGVREIIASYLQKGERDFSQAEFGVELSEGEQRRRWLIKSLFQTDGLDVETFASRFGVNPSTEFPELAEMIAGGYFFADGHLIVPTAKGLEWSDALAPILFSEQVRQEMQAFELR